MSKRKTNSAVLPDERVTTEEEFQEKRKNYPSPFVRSVLEWRRVQTAGGAEFLTLDKINGEVARRRSRDANE